jgi:hypothetical protein
MNPTPRIESDTPIVPRAVMEAVLEEAGVWLGQPLPRRWIRELTARANTVYANNPYFRRNVCATGDKGRNYLWAFTRHWLSGLMWKCRPQIHTRLPHSYSVGHPLPPKPLLPLRRPKTNPKMRSRTTLRRPPRAATNNAFAAAAHFPFP